MLSERSLSRKRMLKNLKRRQVKKLHVALKQYPRQMALRDQLIAAQKNALVNYQQTVVALTKRIKDLEAVYSNKSGLILP